MSAPVALAGASQCIELCAMVVVVVSRPTVHLNLLKTQRECHPKSIVDRVRHSTQLVIA